MTERMLYKTLVVLVIFLFAGIGVQPAFAVTPETTDSEDDCDICPSIGDLVERKDVERYQKLYDKILSLKEINKQFTTDTEYNICIILIILWATTWGGLTSIVLLANILHSLNINIEYDGILMNLFWFLAGREVKLWDMLKDYECIPDSH